MLISELEYKESIDEKNNFCFGSGASGKQRSLC